MRTAVPGSSHCGRTPGSPTARRSRRLTCRRVGLATAPEESCGRHVSRLVQSVAVVGDRALAITLRSQRVDVPLALAHADLAIARSVADSPWPLGTRSSRIATEGHPAAARAATVITVDRDNLPAIRFLVAAGDTRDLLDQGVDLLLTRDPATLELRSHAPAVSVRAAGMAANPRASCTRPLALGGVAVGGRAAGSRRRCGSRRGAGGARSVLVADDGGLRGRTLSAARPLHADSANRLRRERRRGAGFGRALRRPGPCVGSGRNGVSRCAPSGPSTAGHTSAPPG